MTPSEVAVPPSPRPVFLRPSIMSALTLTKDRNIEGINGKRDQDEIQPWPLKMTVRAYKPTNNCLHDAQK
jgi:hypothetical protein